MTIRTYRIPPHIVGNESRMPKNSKMNTGRTMNAERNMKTFNVVCPSVLKMYVKRIKNAPIIAIEIIMSLSKPANILKSKINTNKEI
jgi:hypothetical protein